MPCVICGVTPACRSKRADQSTALVEPFVQDMPLRLRSGHALWQRERRTEKSGRHWPSGRWSGRATGSTGSISRNASGTRSLTPVGEAWNAFRGSHLGRQAAVPRGSSGRHARRAGHPQFARQRRCVQADQIAPPLAFSPLAFPAAFATFTLEFPAGKCNFSTLRIDTSLALWVILPSNTGSMMSNVVRDKVSGPIP
jgi:hypothetical protein